MTIGERLEEARKRKGVSIREAAEATKISGDFLLAMENNSFDINLPEIYIRGFLKNYAKFLKVDPEKLLTDYDATRGIGNTNRRQTVEGAVERFDPPPSSQQPEEIKSSYGRMDLPSSPNTQATQQDVENEQLDEDNEKEAFWNTSYLKIMLGVVGVMFACIILYFLISNLGSDPKPEINPDLAPIVEKQSTTNELQPRDEPVETINTNPIILIALDNVHVIVDQNLDNKRLFQGPLAKDEQKVLEARGPVSIRYSNGQSLLVERNGDRYKMTSTSIGINTVN